jgi:hypothetical protein
MAVIPFFPFMYDICPPVRLMLHCFSSVIIIALLSIHVWRCPAQEVRLLVSRHFGDETPFELPLVSKLYVLRQNSSDSAVDSQGEQADDESDGLKHIVRRR